MFATLNDNQEMVMNDKNSISDYMTSINVIRQFLQEAGVRNIDDNARALIARLIEKDILCIYSEDFYPHADIEDLKSLATAVKMVGDNRVICEDVKGMNWFDARTSIIEKL
jgi:hypothetical protein